MTTPTMQDTGSLEHSSWSHTDRLCVDQATAYSALARASGNAKNDEDFFSCTPRKGLRWKKLVPLKHRYQYGGFVESRCKTSGGSAKRLNVVEQQEVVGFWSLEARDEWRRCKALKDVEQQKAREEEGETTLSNPYRGLVESRGKTRGNGAKRLNAVEQQKEREKEGKALLKQQKADEVAKRHEELEARKRATKEERIYSEKTSRRAREDLRKETKKEAKGKVEECEHGVPKCRVCNPHTDKVDHRATAVTERSGTDQYDQ